MTFTFKYEKYIMSGLHSSERKLNMKYYYRGLL